MASHEPPVDVGLYVHVAFCKTKCYYCDFNTYAGLGHLIPSYVEALRSEIRRLPHSLPGLGPLPGPFRIGSIFFGGGTPSLLNPDQIAAVLDAAASWPISKAAEVTMEANPDDLSRDYLREIRAAGVNRLSVGVQSFDDSMLKRLGRRHDASSAQNALRDARAAGFDNLSFDLMFALPGQTVEQWQQTLDQALELDPDHLSLYNLQIEPDTPFESWVASGQLAVPDDDAAADFYQAAIDRLQSGGYRHYEISNWARRQSDHDFRAQHNLRYWRNQPYFGVGAGAHSGYLDFRYANERRPLAYASRTRHGESTVESVERIEPAVAMAETMMLGLRLDEGVLVETFRLRFGQTPKEVYGETLRELEDASLIVADGNQITLTPRGRFVGNEVFRRFLP